MVRVCLVGAGNIARVHAEALQSLSGVQIASVVDPNIQAARRLAQDWRIPQVHASVEDALESGGFERAHILVPPDVHVTTALPLLGAGKPVLVEKPLAASVVECETLMSAAAASGAAVGINQNFVHHPALKRLMRALEKGAAGPPGFVQCIYNMPLRQLAARQFGNWMFAAPGNILLEQAVHPLSQIAALAGEIGRFRTLAGPVVEIAPSRFFCPTVSLSLACSRLPAQLRFAVGQSFPFWQVSVVCEDGVLIADILNDRFLVQGRTRWPDVPDALLSGTRLAGAIVRESGRGLAEYGLSMLRLKSRSDPFFRSMHASIAAFHADLDAGRPPSLDGRFGRHLVEVCEAIARDALPPAPAAAPRTARPVAASADVVVLGGTGFIGAHVVRRFLREGCRIRVLARHVTTLPAVFAQPSVTVLSGDIGDRAALLEAIGEAPLVINLAHGGGGGSWEQIRQSMVGGAELVAQVCLENGVRRLIHVGSIASLYLGPQQAPITGGTPPDPQAAKRADYARAKAECDRMLLGMHAKQGLPVCILRPGVVVGEGGPPTHSGLGFYNNDQHCIGWNEGRNPLPFVLVEDIAEAIWLAGRAEGVEGRCYNLVGEVRPTARDYVAAMAHASSRPLRFHPQPARLLWLVEGGKWMIKRVAGRRAPFPAFRDIASRGMRARFDCTDAKRDLGWMPNADMDTFLRRAVQVHAPQPSA